MWAHVSELEDPTPWLNGGELIMTTGIGVPKTERSQLLYVQRLNNRGVVGLAIGENMYAPPLRPKVLEFADDTEFPIIGVAREVPFIAIAQRVAAANERGLAERLSKQVRIYNVMHEYLQSPGDPRKAIAELERVLCAKLYVFSRLGRPVLGGGDEADPEAESALEGISIQEMWKQLISSGVADVGGENIRAAVLYRRGSPRGALVASYRSNQESVDYVTLQTAATVVNIILAEVDRQRAIENREKARALTAAVRGELALRIRDVVASQDSGGQSPVFVAGVAPGGEQDAEELRERLAEWGAAGVVGSERGLLYMLAARRHGAGGLSELLREMEECLGGRPIGVAGPLSEDEEVGDVMDRAVVALKAASIAGGGARWFEEGDFVQSVAQGTRVFDFAVKRFVRPILEYDKLHRSRLYPTLKWYLDTDRSIKRTAEKLAIHQQTVIYRLKRLEKLLGIRLSSTEDLALIWLAVRVYEAAGRSGYE
jgi:purine catabolism regulator